MITQKTITDTVRKINASGKHCGVWIINAGASIKITARNTELKQGVYAGTFRHTTEDELGAAIDKAMASDYATESRISDPAIAAVWMDIANRPRAETIVWIDLRTGKLKANGEGKAKHPINETHPGYVGTYTRTVTLAELSDDILHVAEQLQPQRAKTARKHSIRKAVAA